MQSGGRTVQNTAPLRGIFWTALFLLLGLAFWPLTHAAYSNYDDVVFVLTNPLVFDHTPGGLIRIFTSPNSSHNVYVPLTVLSFNVEHMLFGLHPAVSHASNFLLHGLNIFLVFLLGISLGLSRQAAALGAAVFAVHPLHVESVAWVTARKDVLYGVFYLSSLLWYVRYVKTRLKIYYGVALGCALLSVLAKPMALSLPFVLVLVDWFLGRKREARVWLDKIPFFFAVESVAYVTYLQNTRSIPFQFPDAIFIWCWSAAFYIEKFFWPVNLSPLYTLPVPLIEHWAVYVKSLLVFLIAGAAVIAFRSLRWIVFGIMFYVLTMAFLWRFDNFDPAIVADRFMYIPSAGFCLMAGWGMVELMTRSGPWRRVAGGLVVILILSMAVMTNIQTAVWKNCWTMWSRVIQREPNNEFALVSRARCIADPELFDGCRDDFIAYVLREQRGRDPGLFVQDIGQRLDEFRVSYMLSDLAHVQDGRERNKLSYSAAYLLKKINASGADEMIAAAVNANPWVPANLNRRGLAALFRREPALAAEYSKRVLDIDPQDAGALAIQAGAAQMRGRGSEAQQDMCLALRMDPQDAMVRDVVRRLFTGGLRCGKAQTQP
jgi:protein O-mannosyl-transferase